MAHHVGAAWPVQEAVPNCFSTTGGAPLQQHPPLFADHPDYPTGVTARDYSSHRRKLLPSGVADVRSLRSRGRGRRRPPEA